MRVAYDEKFNLTVTFMLGVVLTPGLLIEESAGRTFVRERIWSESGGRIFLSVTLVNDQESRFTNANHASLPRPRSGP